jgi:ATP-binding cassette subfamily C protein
MIARAIVHRPKLLILDEATSALDAATEAALCTTLEELKQQMTIIAISHQPALAQAADQCIRLDRGRVDSNYAPKIAPASG